MSQVKIDKIKPENSFGTDLMNYYFQQDNNGVNLYSPNSSAPVAGPITFGTAFNVAIPNGPTFVVNVTGLSGTWLDASMVGDPGDGTFQAQAGGTGEEEDTASSASA